MKGKEQQELSDVLGKAIVKYLESIKGDLSIYVYFINFGLLGFILLGIWFRQALGNLLWLPFSMIGNIFAKSFKAAKALHNKI